VSAKRVEILEAVQPDLEYARSFYEAWKPGGGDEILRKYFDALDWIEWNPDLFPRKFGLIQRVLLKRSYFVVYFLQEKDRSVIVAVLDGRRDPRVIRKLIHRRRRTGL
jgi:plasmid stabilization system protein ParE